LTDGKLSTNPFDYESEDDIIDIGTPWVVTPQLKRKYDEQFFRLDIIEGKASGAQIKPIMLQSKLSNEILKELWNSADLDQDGFMSSEEFALCMFLLKEVEKEKQLPEQLPENYIPPSFRKKHKKIENPFDSNTLNDNEEKNNKILEARTKTSDHVNTIGNVQTDIDNKMSSPKLSPPLASDGIHNAANMVNNSTKKDANESNPLHVECISDDQNVSDDNNEANQNNNHTETDNVNAINYNFTNNPIQIEYEFEHENEKRKEKKNAYYFSDYALW